MEVWQPLKYGLLLLESVLGYLQIYNIYIIYTCIYIYILRAYLYIYIYIYISVYVYIPWYFHDEVSLNPHIPFEWLVTKYSYHGTQQ